MDGIAGAIKSNTQQRLLSSGAPAPAATSQRTVSFYAATPASERCSPNVTSKVGMNAFRYQVFVRRLDANEAESAAEPMGSLCYLRRFCNTTGKPVKANSSYVTLPLDLGALEGEPGLLGGANQGADEGPGAGGSGTGGLLSSLFAASAPAARYEINVVVGVGPEMLYPVPYSAVYISNTLPSGQGVSMTAFLWAVVAVLACLACACCFFVALQALKYYNRTHGFMFRSLLSSDTKDGRDGRGDMTYLDSIELEAVDNGDNEQMSLRPDADDDSGIGYEPASAGGRTGGDEQHGELK